MSKETQPEGLPDTEQEKCGEALLKNMVLTMEKHTVKCPKQKHGKY